MTRPSEQEELLIANFIVKEKQDRYLGFLTKENTRRKFTKELYHFKHFNWSLFQEIPGDQNAADIILSKLNKKPTPNCYVISVDPEYDGKLLSVDEVITNIIGREGTILVFDDANIIYYEGEGPGNRYISL
ncbi:MAG: hypothetical protein EOP48_13160 [Sphingobacteriales bacterium]|nr:MAG: hypothetical protein EOP48_13160 [Sphingobacteriales bacterium]